MTTRFADHLIGGTHASRPTAASVPVGTLYSCSDHGTLDQSDGSAWSTWATLGATALADLTDVDLTGAADEDSLTYETTSSLWVPQAVSGGGGGSSAPSVDDSADFITKFGADAGYDEEFDASSSSLPSGWSWVNQGTSTYQEDFGAGLLTPQGGSADNVRAIVESLSGAPSTWTITAKFSAVAAASSTAATAGIIFRDSASGKHTSFYYMPATGQFGIACYTNTTTYASALVAATAVGGMDRGVTYLKVVKNSSTSYDFYVSPDGIVWHAFASAQNLSTHLSGGITDVGFMANAYNSQAIRAACHWFRLR